MVHINSTISATSTADSSNFRSRQPSAILPSCKGLRRNQRQRGCSCGVPSGEQVTPGCHFRCQRARVPLRDHAPCGGAQGDKWNPGGGGAAAVQPGERVPQRPRRRRRQQLGLRIPPGGAQRRGHPGHAGCAANTAARWHLSQAFQGLGFRAFVRCVIPMLRKSIGRNKSEREGSALLPAL